MVEQMLFTVFGAFIGGLISWFITHKFDSRARDEREQRDEHFRNEQKARDERQRLFQYRYARYMEWRAAVEPPWTATCNVSASTTTDNWHVIVTNRSGKDEANLQIQLFKKEGDSPFLASSFTDSSLRIPVAPNNDGAAVNTHAPSWEIKNNETLCFGLDEGVTDGEFFIFWTKGSRLDAMNSAHRPTTYPISPFVSMPEFRL